MVKYGKNHKNAGFSLLELMIAMVITMVLLGITSTLLSGALSTRSRESRRTDALASAQAALNIMSREISNAGYGLNGNGIVTEDSSNKRIHFRTNVINDDEVDDTGENITYYFDEESQSIVRFDDISKETSIIINRVSDINLTYWDYSENSSTPTERNTPTSFTARVTINVVVQLENVQGQPINQKVAFTSDVTLRNSEYMLFQY
jgi:type II secretory pathway pseudopilin PulG